MPIYPVTQNTITVESTGLNGAIEKRDSSPKTNQDFVNDLWLGSPAISLCIIFFAYWLLRKNNLISWAKQQFLAHPSQSLKPARWVVSLIMVAILSYLFDKLAVSRISNLNATAHDIVFLNLFTIVICAYLYSLSFIWGIEATIDRKLIDSEKNRLLAEATAEQHREEVDSERRISQLSNRILGERWDRVKSVLRSETDNISAEDFINTIQPEMQLVLIMTSIHQFVSSHFKGGLSPQHQLRVAYYLPDDGFLKPIISYDGNSSNCIRTPANQFRDRFQLTPDKARDCLAVHCALNGPLDPILISDTDVADKDPAIPYRHFSDDQSTHIKSIAGYCCKRANGDEPPHGVLTLDCSLKDFFNDDEITKLTLRRMLDDLTLRLAYESDLFDIIQYARESTTCTEAQA